MDANALFSKGLNALKTKDYNKAIKVFKKLERSQPKNVNILNNLALSYQHSGKVQIALDTFKKVLLLNPSMVETRKNIILIYLKAGNIQKTFETTLQLLNHTNEYEFFLKIAQNFIETNNLPLAAELLEAYQQKNPFQIDISIALAKIYHAMQKTELAIQLLEQTYIKDKSEITLDQLVSYYEKTNSMEKAISLLLDKIDRNPRADHFSKLTYFLSLKLSTKEKAKSIANLGLQRFPKNQAITVCLISTYLRYHEYDVALGFLEQLCKPYINPNIIARTDIAKELSPIMRYALVKLCFLYLTVCHFEKFNLLHPLMEKITDYELENHEVLNTSPFMATLMLDPEKYQIPIARKQAQMYDVLVKHKILSKPHQNTKVKLGYISGDFHDHAVGFLISNLLSYHNKEKFEIYAYYTQHTEDLYTNTIRQSVDHFKSLNNLSDLEAAKTIQEDKIDILIDLSGYTANSRMKILAYQPAPIQCHYMGSMTTLGSSYIQCIISHKDIIPPSMQRLYTEEIIYLSDTIYARDNFSLPPMPKNSDYKLPDNKIIFCNFSNSYRIDIPSLEAWFEILNQVPGSILWLRSSSKIMIENIQTIAVKYDVPLSRLFFNNFSNLSDRWPMRLARIWLDPFGQSSGTSTIMCCYANVPVLTLKGTYPHQRLSTSILNAANSKELITDNKEDYINKAIQLATDDKYYHSIIQTLNDAKRASPLFSPQNFVHNLEMSLLEHLNNLDEANASQQ